MKVAYWATASVVGLVPATVFVPSPNVESALVRIERRPTPAVGPEVDPERLFALVGTGFRAASEDAATLAGGLVGADAFAAADVNPEARAEELDVTAWGRLAAAAGVSVAAPRRGEGSGGSLLAGAALPAGGLQHLLVLLLPHALAALLYQRSHERRQANGRSPHPCNCLLVELAFALVTYDQSLANEQSISALRVCRTGRSAR